MDIVSLILAPILWLVEGFAAAITNPWYLGGLVIGIGTGWILGRGWPREEPRDDPGWMA